MSIIKLFLFSFFLFSQISFSQKQEAVPSEISSLLRKNSWTHHAFALLRLEKYPDNPNNKRIIYNVLGSKKTSWQAKVFAIRAAARLKIEIPDSFLARIKDPFLMRAVIYSGIEVKDIFLEKFIREATKKKGNLNQILIHEVVAASSSEKARKLTLNSVRRINRILEEYERFIYKDRICRIFGVAPSEITHDMISSIVTRHTTKERFFKDFKLPDNNLFISMNEEDFSHKTNYFEKIQDQGLDIFFAIDGTGSMGRVIEEVRSNIVDLMTIFQAFSKSFKMGIVIYRDKQDGKPQYVKLTNDPKKLLTLMIKVQAKGGFDPEEWILSGVEIAEKAGWSRDSKKHFLIIGDAPSHGRDYSELVETLEKMNKKKGILTHTIVCSDHEDSVGAFESYAGWGNGKAYKLNSTSELSNLMIKSSLDSEVHDLFDEFYEIFKIYCM